MIGGFRDAGDRGGGGRGGAARLTRERVRWVLCSLRAGERPGWSV